MGLLRDDGGFFSGGFFSGSFFSGSFFFGSRSRSWGWSRGSQCLSNMFQKDVGFKGFVQKLDYLLVLGDFVSVTKTSVDSAKDNYRNLVQRRVRT